MMKLTLRDPFKGMVTYRRDLNRWFEEPFGWLFRHPYKGWRMPVRSWRLSRWLSHISISSVVTRPAP